MFHCGITQVVNIDGKRYKLSRFTRSLVRKWLDWADSVIDDPLPTLLSIVYNLPPANRLPVLDEAERIAALRKNFDDPNVSALWNSEEGDTQTFCLLLEKFHWDIDPAPIAEKAKSLYSLPRLILNASGYIRESEMAIERAYMVKAGMIRPAKTQKPLDWQIFDQKMMEQFNLRPHDIDDMTLPEISVLGDKGSASDGFEIADKYHQLKDEQKTELAIIKINSHLN